MKVINGSVNISELQYGNMNWVKRDFGSFQPREIQYGFLSIRNIGFDFGQKSICARFIGNSNLGFLREGPSPRCAPSVPPFSISFL